MKPAGMTMMIRMSSGLAATPAAAQLPLPPHRIFSSKRLPRFIPAPCLLLASCTLANGKYDMPTEQQIARDK